VKDALEKKYLASLQLSFYEGKVVCPDALVEAYTLSFTYNEGDASVHLSTESRAGESRIGKSMMLFDAKEGMRRLMQSNFMTAKELHDEVPDLPGIFDCILYTD
jgi:hypothetical protein